MSVVTVHPCGHSQYTERCDSCVIQRALEITQRQSEPARVTSVGCLHDPWVRNCENCEIVAGCDIGVQDIVAHLRRLGFETTDSGDGWSKGGPDNDALDYAHIYCASDRGAFVTEAGRCLDALRTLGENVFVEASYSPNDGTAFLLIRWDGPRGNTT